MPSWHLCPQCLLQSLFLSWDSVSYFDPEHKASFVLRIKSGKGFEEQGSIWWHALQLFVCFLLRNDQDQFLLPRNGFSDLILDFVAIWPFLVMNLPEYCTMHDWNRIALLHPNFVNQWRRLFFRTILQFSYNFSLVVANSVCLFVLSCFVVFFHFVF